MCMSIMPAAVLSMVTIICNVILGTLIIVNKGFTTELAWLVINMIRGVYEALFIVGTVTTITEWKKINLGSFRKILYMFTFPIFMLTYIPISVVAIFKKVTWQPIEHHGSKSNLGVKTEKPEP